MHKIQKRCKNCKYLQGDHSLQYCGSKLSKNYKTQVYPQDENCEVFYPGTKRKSKNKKRKKGKGNQEGQRESV